MLDIRRGTMFRLNPIGSRILDMSDKGESLASIANQISAEFGVAFDVVQTDVKEFLNSLQLHGLLDPRGPKA